MMRGKQRQFELVSLQASQTQQLSSDLKVAKFLIGIDCPAINVQRQRVAPVPALDRNDVVDKLLA